MADQQFINDSNTPANEPGLQAAQDQDKTQQVVKNDKTVDWQASEFIEHSKNSTWFLILIGGAVVIAVIMYLLTKNILTAVVIILTAVAVAQLGHSKPTTNSYSLSFHGLTINGKFYPLSNFKSFSVFKDGAIEALHFESAKRFSNPVTIYFAPDDQSKIIEVLEKVMPQDTYKPDAFDRAMRRVRF